MNLKTVSDQIGLWLRGRIIRLPCTRYPRNPVFRLVCCAVASVVSNSVILWTIACQAPLSMGFSRQGCWRIGCHFLLQGIFLTLGLNWCLLCLLHWKAGSSPPSQAPPGKPHFGAWSSINKCHFLTRLWLVLSQLPKLARWNKLRIIQQCEFEGQCYVW